jgi:hypothetical protein
MILKRSCRWRILPGQCLEEFWEMEEEEEWQAFLFVI